MRIFTILFVACLGLAACGGGSGGATGTKVDAGTGQGSVAGAGHTVLFVADSGNHVLAGVDTLTPSPGTKLAANVLSSALGWNGIAYDSANDRLYANVDDGDCKNPRIAVFERASTLGATSTPAYTVVPAYDRSLACQVSMFYDKLHDRMYIGVSGDLAVFDHFSTLRGAVKPSRTASSLAGFEAFNFTVDVKRNLLYTHDTHNVDREINVFEQADQLGSPGFAPNPKKIYLDVSMDTFLSVQALAIDQERDILYAAGRTAGSSNAQIMIVRAASSQLQTDVDSSTKRTALSMIALPQALTGLDRQGVAVDVANDRLYAGAANTAYIVNAVSKVNGKAEIVAVPGPVGTQITNFAF
jgi:hypothetical protein